MSVKTRIPLKQVFRSRSSSDFGLPAPDPSLTKERPLRSLLNPSSEEFERGRKRRSQSLEGQTLADSFIMASNNVDRGTRTPKMIEFERQAEQRQQEMERVQAERDRIADDEEAIRRDQERISQEEYEMEQYYEAEALRHAEELRLHQEEVKRHQERRREHERKLRDHEASSEAFAKVIAMPARPARERQVSFLNVATNGLAQGGRPGGFSQQVPGLGLPGGQGRPPAQFPGAE